MNLQPKSRSLSKNYPQTCAALKKLFFLFALGLFTLSAEAQTWTGAVSSDWHNTANWSGGLPSELDFVVINSTPNNPRISGSETILGVQVNIGASLTIESGGTLNLHNQNPIVLAILDVYEGTVVNEGTINITSNNNEDNGILVENGTFTNESTTPGGSLSTAVININGLAGNGIQVRGSGTFTNQDAVINIGQNSAIGQVGIWVKDGTFSNVKEFINSPAAINIDDTGGDGIYVGSDGSFFHNAGSILIGANTTVGGHGVNNSGTFTAQKSVTIARASGRGIQNNSGATFNNSATFSIGTVSAVGGDGVYNQGTFNNSSIVRVHRASGNGFLSLAQGQFNNQNGSQLLIGTSATVGGHGVHLLGGGFTNNGTVTVARAGNRGLFLQSISSFTNNNGKNVNIGTVGVGGIGLYIHSATAVFVNNGGNIKINNTGSGSSGTGNDGIFAMNGASIENKNGGEILIGQTGSIGGAGIQLFNFISQLVNNNGTIKIDGTAAEGIRVDNTSKVENKNGGQIYIGENSTIGTTTDAAIEAGGAVASVINSGCSEMYLYDHLQLGNTPFTNAGFLFIDADQAHTNTATLTNNGVINYVQDNPVPNVTNNDLIIALYSITDCTLSDVVQKGGANNFNPNATWFTNAGMTNPGGTYSSGTNVFAPSTFPSGTNTYYFQVSGNGCTFDAQIVFVSNGNKTWTGAESTDWGEPCNWSPAGVPTGADDVEIPDAANDPVIGGATMAFAKSVKVQASAELHVLTGGSLSIDVQGGPEGLVNIGTIDNAGTIDIENLTYQALYNLGNFTNDGTIDIENVILDADFAPGLSNEGNFTNNGTIDIDDSGDIGFNNRTDTGASFTNYGTLNIGVSEDIGNVGIMNQSGAIFNNEFGGEINIGNTGYREILNRPSSIFNNRGTINIIGTSSPPFSNFGIENNDGAFNNEACALINIVPNVTIQSSAGSTFTNDGIIIENSNGNSSITTNNGIVQNLNGGTFNIGTNNGNLIAGNKDAWTGCVDTNWDNAENWLDGSVPTAADDVLIPVQGSAPVIGSSTVAVAKSVEVQTGAQLTIESGASLDVDFSDKIGIINEGTVNNSGAIDLDGPISILDTKGIRNKGTFNNFAGGTISIDQLIAWPSGFGDGISTSSGSTFNNSGTIVIGADFPVEYGIYSIGIFNNLPGGQLIIDRIEEAGITVELGGGEFSNEGAITIGSIAPVQWPVKNLNIFENKPGGTLSIENSIGSAIQVAYDGSLTNDGLINVGLTSVINYKLIDNGGDFINNGCGEINARGSNEGIHNGLTSTFTNSGLLVIDAPDPLVNHEVFINNGVIQNVQGALNTNGSAPIVNNDLIITPITIDCNLADALQIGGANSFTVLSEWFNDSGLSDKAGDYNQPNNLFSPTNLAAGTNTLYFTVNDGTCTYNTSIEVSSSGAITSPDRTWNGSVSSDWNDVCNWTPAYVPTAASVVTIPDVANDPVIDGSTAAVVNSVVVEQGATLTVQTNGNLSTEGAVQVGILVEGTLVNSGLIQTDQMATNNSSGIELQGGSLSNQAGGIIEIENSKANGIYVNIGLVDNFGTINIGQGSSNITSFGITVIDSLHNAGSINIDNINTCGVVVTLPGGLSNEGDIYIGQNGAMNNRGILIVGNLDNWSSGNIFIDQGLIGIDNAGPFTNNGHLEVGSNSSMLQAIFNDGQFTNNACGEIFFGSRVFTAVDGNLSNAGLIIIDTDEAHANSGTVTNSGLIEYRQLPLIPNVTNNEIIVAPTQTSNCGAVTPAFGLGAVIDFNILGIFTGANATVSAGTYDVSTNTFIAATPLTSGSQTFYVKIEDPVNNCESIAEWTVDASNTAVTWTGAISSDWNDPGNWDGYVPLVCDDVIIPETNGYKPIIDATTSAVAKSVTLEMNGFMTIESGGSLNVDGADGDGITMSGDIDNSGTINIGQSLGVGGHGVKVNPSGTFHNDFNSVLNIDNTSSDAIYNASIFRNSGILNIGQINQTNSIGNRAIYNNGTFTNEAGEINIDRILSNRKAILNNSGTFTNKAIIHIGANTEAGSEGIENRASFNNDTGEINIDRTSERGILNKGTFTNKATINIGANASVGSFGIEIQASPGGSFINEAGEINIDRATFDGLSIPSGVFRNRANINIGCNSNTISTGLYCDGPFINESGELIIKNTTSRALQVTSGTSIINEACASIRLFDNMIVGNAENDGFFSVDAADNSQVFFFENNGILEDVQGTVPTDIAGFENNEIIIAPTQASNCGAVASAFDFGATVDFDILGIFTDENATISAGIYDESNNIFTPTNVLTIGNNSFYVKIEDSGNGCEFIAEWTVEATVADVTWTGAVSSDWDDAGNWDIRVPSACDNVVIPDTNNDPIILEGTSAVAKSVEIASGAVLTLNAGSSLTIDGSAAHGISNNGFFNNNGTVTIDNTGSHAYQSNDDGAACSNSGQFDIGQNGVAATINGIGVSIIKGTFDNLANGEINIDNTSLDGMFTDDINNSGTINIGLNGGSIGDDGLHQYGGTVVNTGTLVINGAGVLAYHSEGTLDNSGMLKGTGTFFLNGNALGGTLAPGMSPGKMTFLSDQEFQAAQTMEIEVEGTTPETQHDVVEVNGTATISGTLAVSISYTPSSNDRIVFLEATTVSGSFSAVSPSLPAGWVVDYSVPGEVALQFSGVLPVELVYFSATKKEEEVELKWQTASETNNEGFEVEHSTDGRDWDYLDFVGGHGNSTEAHDYSFQHKRPSSGINYYRLRQVDFDGQWEYSKVRSVEFDRPSGQIKVFPNPAVHYAMLSLPNFSGIALVQIIAPNGRTIHQMNLVEGEQQVRLGVNSWPAGVYFIQVTLNGQTSTQRLILNKL